MYIEKIPIDIFIAYLMIYFSVVIVLIKIPYLQSILKAI
jgi:hypothetical protein